MFGREIYIELLCRGSLFPHDYPVNTVKYFSEQEFADLQWATDESAKLLSKKYAIDSWVTINQIVPISWETWLNLDELTKRAIGLQIEEISRQRQQVTKEQENKLEKLMAGEAAAVKFPSAPTSNISRFFNT